MRYAKRKVRYRAYAMQNHSATPAQTIGIVAFVAISAVISALFIYKCMSADFTHKEAMRHEILTGE